MIRSIVFTLAEGERLFLGMGARSIIAASELRIASGFPPPGLGTILPPSEQNR
jgi:hypothetical protein